MKDGTVVGMRFGQEAIDLLVRDYPTAHRFFGEHRSIEHFAVTVSSERWFVVERDACWLIVEQVGRRWEAHWFCPGGADTSTMRVLLDTFFAMTGAESITGQVPSGHPNERMARVSNRALGAEKIDNMYFLTLDKHLAYNHADSA